MTQKTQDYITLLNSALERYRDGFDPSLIELKEQAIFPHLIPVQPSTARKSRLTGQLLGRPAPKFVRRGRSIRYRLIDLLKWLQEGDAVSSNAEANVKNREATEWQASKSPKEGVTTSSFSR
jgi:hypothetical protein